MDTPRPSVEPLTTAHSLLRIDVSLGSTLGEAENASAATTRPISIAHVHAIMECVNCNEEGCHRDMAGGKDPVSDDTGEDRTIEDITRANGGRV